MAEIYFCADHHFGHKGIIQFSETKPFRPFNSIEEHDEELVKRWNSVVKPKDTVWHLGDVVFGRRNLPILERLNGYKRLVMGNHDVYGADEYLKYFATLHGAVEYKGMILTHIPVNESQLKRYYLNIHGHLHTRNVQRECIVNYEIDGVIIPKESEENDPRYICVSVEQTKLAPVPLDWIYDKWAESN